MKSPTRAGESRFRLRLLLQEIRLNPGETVIGRSDECGVTIFDPLISRRHARIVVTDDSVVLEDLGSRNGVRVNGELLRAPRELKEGDRIRIGKHELVFSASPVPTPQLQFRQTGSLVYCASCDMAYPGELGMCPTCGSHKVLDEETRSGVFNDSDRQGWALDMILDLLKKAIASGRDADVDRAMRQAMSNLESQIKGPHAPDPARICAVAELALQLAEMQNNAFWANWVSDFYRRAAIPLPPSILESAAKWSVSGALHDGAGGGGA